MKNILECDLDNYDHFKYFINRIHNYTTYRTVPKRSPRILICGAAGCGKTTITQMISQKYCFAEIQFAHLLRQRQRMNEGETEINKSITEAISTGNLVDNHLVNMIFANRFSAKDIHILGCVLDGYPKTPDQMAFMEENLAASPSHIFVLNVDEKTLNARIGDRMQDPKTLIKYRRNELETLDREIFNRLQPIAEETSETLQHRIARWNTLNAHLRDKYKDIVYDIDGNMTPENIVEKISFYLEKQK